MSCSLHICCTLLGGNSQLLHVYSAQKHNGTSSHCCSMNNNGTGFSAQYPAVSQYQCQQAEGSRQLQEGHYMLDSLTGAPSNSTKVGRCFKTLQQRNKHTFLGLV